MCWFSSFIHFILVSVAAVDLATRRAAASKKPTKRNPKLWFSDNWPKLEFNTGKQGWLNKIMFFTKHKPHTGRRKGRKCHFLFLVTFTFDLWPWPSNSSKRGTNQTFCVNLAQIHSVFSAQDISYANKKPTDWRHQKRSAVDCMQ